jgi:hypothetical protein
VEKYLALFGVAACLLIAGTQKASAQSTQYAMDAPSYTAPGGLTLQALGTESFSYNSNPLLLTTGAKSLWGSITSPEMLWVDKTPTSSILSDTVFSSNNFNQSDFNSNDVHSKLSTATQTEQWNASFLGSVDYDTTRTSEISVYNNLRPTPVRHLGENLTPEIGYSFLPTDTVSLTGGYSESQYASSVFTDYHTYSITPSYTHNFDPMNAGVVSFEAQRYQALQGPNSITDTVGPTIGWKKTFTEQLSGTANIGIQETRQQNPGQPQSGWTQDVNYLGSLIYNGEQDLVNATASRSEYPFGNGTEALLTNLSLSETHALNPLFSISGLGNYQSATYQSTATGDLKSLAAGSANVTYHMTAHLDLTATYEYQYETLEGGGSNSARNNMGLLSLTYRPTAWTF